MFITLKRLIATGVVAVSAATPAAWAQAAPEHKTPASAEAVRGGMIDASEPDRMTAFMTALGYEAALSRDDYGDPLIRGRLSSTDYAIQFYECEEGETCNSVQFVADIPPPPGLTLELINRANMTWRYARVSAHDDALRVQMDVNLDGGVTAMNFEDTLYAWRQLIELFETEFVSGDLQ